MSIHITVCKVGSLETNCYIVTDEESGKALIVDPGEFDESLAQAIHKNKITGFEYILLTHGHHDHILAVETIQKNYGGKVVIHEKDSDCFSNGTKSLLSFSDKSRTLPVKADRTVKDSDVLPFAENEIKVIHTPGHTEGSVCYCIGDSMFSGDTLFKETVGRTDFPTGNMLQMLRSVNKLKSLDFDYKIYPGHGEPTTLEHEKQMNYYMRIKK